MLKLIELFSGIGSQYEALKQCGIPCEPIARSDIESHANKVYEMLHGSVPNLGDISKISRLPTADLWTYSFPCQDISTEGKTKGFEKGSGTRSSLLWEVGRLLKTAYESNSLPKYLLMENVDNIVSMKFRQGLNKWIEFLRKLGYRSYGKVLNSIDFGIPQNRRRFFLVSKLDSKPFIFPEKIERNKLVNFLEKEVKDSYFIEKNPIIYEKPDFFHFDRNHIFIYDNMAIIPSYTKIGYMIGLKGDGIYVRRFTKKRGTVKKEMIPTIKTSPQDIGVLVNKNGQLHARLLTPRECFRLMGWKDNRIDTILETEKSNTWRYHMAGNAIVINVLEEIFKSLLLQ